MSLNQSFAKNTKQDKLINTIDFTMNSSPSEDNMVRNYYSNTVGSLSIKGKSFDMNLKDIDYLLDTLERAKEVYFKKYKLRV